VAGSGVIALSIQFCDAIIVVKFERAELTSLNRVCSLVGDGNANLEEMAWDEQISKPQSHFKLRVEPSPLTLSAVHLFGLRFPIGPQYMTGRGVHEMSPGTQRAANPNILVVLGVRGVFFLDPTLHLKPTRGAFIEKSLH
jgi:hypothetical protein